ncbi:hypothetical protein Poly51_44710 [Rubripirellula tenax]|uniref:DUF7619 domain-containing protein n=1 Tax=Rubripirellula tenax TaxID=2528015 RepID=A0A5C6ELU7_9BACT|nr:dockerin type I domain-containing protein [Rubripirellula tenax]TWU48571.1 hypothetical protein Poly51_44710 [Rubripirellula tenax]
MTRRLNFVYRSFNPLESDRVGRSRRTRASLRGIEALEQRQLLAAFIWNTDSDGLWSDPANWSGGVGVPGTGDTVTIDRGAANPTITIASPVQIDALMSTESIVMQADFRINDDAVLSGGEFRWQAGWLRTGTLTTEDDAKLIVETEANKRFSGDWTNSGIVDQQQPFASPSSGSTILNEAEGVWSLHRDFNFAGSFSITFTNEGTLRKTGSESTSFYGSSDRVTHVTGSRIEVLGGTLFLPISGTSAQPSTGAHFDVAAGASLDITSGTSYYVGTYTGTGAGRIEHSQGRIDTRGATGTSGTVFDFADGLFHWTGGTIFTDNDGGDTLVNAGHMSWSGSGERTLWGQEFHNEGEILITASGNSLFSSTGQGTWLHNDAGGIIENVGTSAIIGGRTFNNSIIKNRSGNIVWDSLLVAGEGSTLAASGGRFLLERGGQFASSTIDVDAGGVVEFNGTAGNSEIDLLAGTTLTGTGDGRIEFTGGRIESVGSDAVIDFADGLFRWIGGTFFRDITSTGQVTIEGTGAKQLLNAFTNTGTIIQTAGTTVTSSSAGFINAAGAAYELQGDANIAGVNLSTATLRNSGTVRKTGAGTARIVDVNVALVHLGGIVEVVGGDLVANHSSNFVATGAHFDVAAGSTIEMVGRLTSTGRYTGDGGGLVKLSARLDGDGRDFTLDFPEGFFELTGSGASSHTGFITNDGFITLRNSDEAINTGATFINNGTLIQASGTDVLLRNSSSTINHGDWIVQGDANIELQQFDGLFADFNNFGSFVKTGGGTTAITISGGVTPFFSNPGLVRVDDGTLTLPARDVKQFDRSSQTLHGGSWQVGEASTLRFLDDDGEDEPIQTNYAAVRLVGAGAAFPSLASLAVNGGQLLLDNGQAFSTVGNFTNGVTRSSVRLEQIGYTHTIRTVGIAVDPVSGDVVTHSRNERIGGEPVFRRFGANFLETSDPIVQPGGSVNVSGIDILSGPMNVGGTTVPAGSMLFVHANATPATLYAINPDSGEVLATVTVEGVGIDRAGVAEHPTRGTVYLLGLDAMIHEINPATGAVLRMFSANPAGVSAIPFNQGGIDVVGATGQLLVVGTDSRVRVLTATGSFVSDIDLRYTGADPFSLSDVSYNDTTGETWVSTEVGNLFRFSPVASGTFGHLKLASDVDLIVDGDFASTGYLTLSVGGRPVTGDFSNITATGAATLGGTLDIVTTKRFDSQSMDAYQMIGFNSRTGTFDQVFAGGFETIVEDNAVFAFADRAPSIDLVVSEVSGPATALVGDRVTIEWTVTNLGENEAVGPWYDEIRLRPPVETDAAGDPITFANDIVVGGFNVNAGMTLAPFESKTFSMEILVVAALPGVYRWVVETNRRGNVLEAEGRQNNDSEAFETVDVDFRELPNDGTVLVGQFLDQRQPQWYKVTVPAGEVVGVDLQMLGSGNSINELYVARNYIPTRVNFDGRQTKAGQANVTTIINGLATDSTWYITAFPASFDSANASFNISAVVLPPSIESVSPGRIGNTGQATLTIAGARLDADLQYRIVGAGGVNRPAITVERIDDTRVVAKFDLDGLAIGDYDVVASDGMGDVSTLTAGIRVEETRQAEIQIDLTGSTRVRSGRTITYTIRYSNPSNVDMKLPFITVNVEGGGTLRARYDSTIRSDELFLFPPPVAKGSSVIPPGASGTVQVYYDAPLDEGDFSVSAWGNTVDEPDFGATTFDWDLISANLRPAGSDETSWNEYIDVQRARYGETFAELYEFLADQVEELSRDGFRNLVFVNGQWFFDLPTIPPGPSVSRGISSDEFAPLAVVSDSTLMSRSPEGETTTRAADGRQDIYAVVVGNPDGTLTGGADVDGNTWANFFTKTLNIGSEEGAPSPIIVDTDGSANADDYLGNINSVRSRADEDDLIFVTYAGHGFCRTNDEGAVVGGNLAFKDRELTGSELQAAVAGSTRTVVVIDSCHAGAITSEIKALNVTSIAAADANFSILNDNSLTQNLVPLLLKDPSQDIHAAVGIAAKTLIETGFKNSNANPRTQENVNNALLAVRSGTVKRTLEPQALINKYKDYFAGLVLAEMKLDADGDGKNDFILFDTDFDGEFDTKIPDYDQSGAVNGMDFRRVVNKETNAIELPNPRFQNLATTPQLLTPEELIEFAKFEKIEAARDASFGKGLGSASLPELDARGGELKITNPDAKTSQGGTIEQVEEEQTLNISPDTRLRGERGRSFDPNEKVGPLGFGAAGFIREGVPMPFTIYFENDPEQATLPAQEVFITEVLDDDLDLTTFELGDIIVGGRFIDVPERRSAWSTTERITVGEIELDLQIDAELDFVTRTVTWTFTSLDPNTGVLTELFDAGFLPPNDDTGRGEGNVSYTVSAKSGLASGTQISGAAEIVFDVNEPLITNSTLNTIDITPPTSLVADLPATSLAVFDVTWSGDDAGGSGIASFEISVSTNDGDFELWHTAAAAGSRAFVGQVGSTYAFQSFAVDQVGNRQAQPQATPATTLVTLGPWTNPRDIYDVDDLNGVTAVDALVIINELGRRRVSDARGVLVALPPDGFAPPYYDVNVDGSVTALDALRVINQLGRIRANLESGEGLFESEFTFQPRSLAMANPPTRTDALNREEVTQAFIDQMPDCPRVVSIGDGLSATKVTTSVAEIEVTVDEIAGDVRQQWNDIRSSFDERGSGFGQDFL